MAEAELQTIEAVSDDESRRVRIPLFPKYSSLRFFASVLDGTPTKAYADLRQQLWSLRGTPQANEDWSDPDRWIPERLSGAGQGLAMAFWERSGRELNPRHTMGCWYVSRTYGLVEEKSGTNLLTDDGRSFLENPLGTIESRIDTGEGLFKVLSLVAERGPTRASLLTETWAEYLQLYSNYRTETTIRDTLWRRLRNLVDRLLLDRAGKTYQVTPAGLTYLATAGADQGQEQRKSDEQTQIYRLARAQGERIRSDLREYLESMDPISFESVVKRLLEEMGYENVEVTAPSNDKGVDVTGDIELGITNVHEVVQVKRHQNNLHRAVLDQLRGSLHRFLAIRGTIITTGGFSKGARDAAFEAGAPPITLIDGDKLLDLLLEHGIGIRRRTVEVLELNTDSLLPPANDIAE